MILRGNFFSHTLEIYTPITFCVPSKKPFNHQTYKVVYLLHPLQGNNDSWVDNTMLPAYLQSQPILFVMPNVARSFYRDMTFGSPFFTYLTEELPAFCQSLFNISTQPEDTAIMGASMGGYGALLAAFHYPKRYGYCCPIAPGMVHLKQEIEAYLADPKRTELVMGKQFLSDFKAIFGPDIAISPEMELLSLAEKAQHQLDKPKIYLTCGEKDFLINGVTKFSQEMSQLDFDFTFDHWPGLHDWFFFTEALKKSIDFCFKP